MEEDQVVTTVRFESETPGETRALTGNIDGYFKLWDLRSGRLVHQVGARQGSAITAASFSDDRTLLSAGLMNGLNIVYNYPEMSIVGEFSHEDCITTIHFTPDNKSLIVGADRTHFWSIEREEELMSFPAPVYLNWEVTYHDLSRRLTGPSALSPDGKQLVMLIDSVVEIVDLQPPSE